MSILIEKTIKYNIKSSSENSYPPNDVYNVKHGPIDASTIYIQWHDPEDTIANKITLSTWKHTLLVRKENSYPTNPTDGVVVIDNYERNKYSETKYQDDGLNENTVYYYRFFVYNTNEECNFSSNMVFYDKPVAIQSNFSDNSLEAIINAAENNKIPDTWQIGDEITITMDGKNVILQIWDFDHYDKSDGSGKAKLCLGCKEIYTDNRMGSSNISPYNTWEDTEIREILNGNIYNQIPEPLRSAIKTVNITASSYYGVKTTEDKLFIPALTELTREQGTVYQGEAELLPLFSEGYNVLRTKIGDSSGNYHEWWLRTGVAVFTSAFFYIDDGPLGEGWSDSPTSVYGILFGFNI